MALLTTLVSLYAIFEYGGLLQPVVARANRHTSTTGIMDSINFPTNSNPRHHEFKENSTNVLNVNGQQRWTVNVVLSVGNPGYEQRIVHSQGVLIHPNGVFISDDASESLARRRGDIFIEVEGKYTTIFKVSHWDDTNPDGSKYNNVTLLILSEPVLGRRPIPIAAEDNQFPAGSICSSFSGEKTRGATRIVVPGTAENKFIYTKTNYCSHSVPEDHYEILVCPSGKRNNAYVLASLTKMSQHDKKKCQTTHTKIGFKQEKIDLLMGYIESQAALDPSTSSQYHN